MTDTKKQKDVLDELLCGSSGSETTSQPEIEQLSQLLNPLARTIGGKASGRKKSSRSASPDTGEMTSSQAGAAQGQGRSRAKKKATHYLSPEVAVRLDDIQMRMQQLLSAEAKTRLSKSQIVEMAIRQILAEFETKEKESLLMTWIVERLE